MDKKLKDKILGQALTSYYIRIGTEKIEDTVTVAEFARVATTVLNTIDVNDIIASHLIARVISVRDEL